MLLFKAQWVFPRQGKLPVAAKKTSGENNGTAHGARPFSALLKLCGTRKCEEGYSQISYNRVLVCLLYQKQTKNSDSHDPHISLIAEFFCMTGTPWPKQIPNCLPPQRHGNLSLFFNCQWLPTIHWPFILIKAKKKSPTHHSRGMAFSQNFWSQKLIIFRPHIAW